MDGAAPRAAPPRIALGIGDVAEIANPASVARASRRDAASRHSQAKASPGALAPLASVAVEGWHSLADRAIEPNGYYLPGWTLAIDASARGRTRVSALGAWSEAAPNAARLIGLMPAVSLWRATKIPLPALVSADPYGTLCTPLLDREMPEQAAGALMSQARDAGAHALILRDVALDGAVMKTFARVLEQGGLRPRLLQSHARALIIANGETGTWPR